MNCCLELRRFRLVVVQNPDDQDGWQREALRVFHSRLAPASALPRPARVPVVALPLDRLRAALPPSDRARLDGVEAVAPALLEGRRVWCVSSTARGGGVAELLRSFVGYAAGMGVDARWMVLAGDPAFFRFTKRLHDLLHGVANGGLPSAADRGAYARVTAANAHALARLVRPGDVVVLHDPQTAGLVEPLQGCGAVVVWRCHIGTEQHNAAVAHAWEFLLPLLAPADGFVFTGAWAVPAQLSGRTVHLIAPSIDPQAPKNRALAPAAGERLLRPAGLAFAIHPRLVLHLGRWDRLKDPVGVIDMFERHVLPHADARLVVAGPPVGYVADDPTAVAHYDAVRRRWAALPAPARARIQIACLPLRENALIVNALQRQATVVVKKSLAEGFGLGVTEALWKQRAVVAAAVGGVRDQIDDGRSGVLVPDPTDLEAFGASVVELLGEPLRRAALGAAGRERVGARYLHDRHMADWTTLLAELLQPAGATAAVGGG